jgi:hypothetical protein
MSQIVTLQELKAVKRSVGGRLSRLRESYRGYPYWTSSPTPITKITAFQKDVNDMEDILRSMKDRLDNAKVTIEI